MDLSSLVKLKGIQRQAKRIGRGGGSGKGFHTVGRGAKGMKARTGYNLPVGFEGGQVPLYKRMPKRKGFVRMVKRDLEIINVSRLNKFETGASITPEVVIKAKLVSNPAVSKIKILGNGSLEKKLHLNGFIYSASAIKKITDQGGEAL